MNIDNKIGRLRLNLIIGGFVAGALYFAYRKGRIDEIDEICTIVGNHGEVKLTFRPYEKVKTILMQKV